MATVTLPPRAARRLPAFQYTSLPLKTFSLDEYHRLIDSGGIATNNRMELLHGLLVYKMPQNFPHSTSSGRLEIRVIRLLDGEWVIRVGKPISFPENASELEPDIAVVHAPESRYDGRQPQPADVEWIVEVSHSTLDYDRGDKLATYAAAGIPVYWVVNLIDKQIEVYTKPKGQKYAKRTDYKPGDAVPVTVAGKKRGTIAVSDVMP